MSDQDYPSVVALVQARVLQRLGQTFDDADQLEYGRQLERQALDAINAGLAVLPQKNPSR